jgi:hypothetical protein
VPLERVSSGMPARYALSLVMLPKLHMARPARM